jgi:hypothetical protein
LAERGNWQNVMGATLFALFEKRKKKKKKEIQKKPRSKNKKRPLKKSLPATDRHRANRHDLAGLRGCAVGTAGVHQLAAPYALASKDS